jgi:hypothetical protein
MPPLDGNAWDGDEIADLENSLACGDTIEEGGGSSPACARREMPEE